MKDNIFEVDRVRYFFDMDGTLMVFRWCEPEDILKKGFFANQEVHWAVAKAINLLSFLHPDDCYMLTAAPEESKYAVDEKIKVCSQHIPNMRKDHIIILPNGSDKTLYVPNGVGHDDMLIDDYTRNLEQWLNAGGFAVKCKTEINGTKHVWDGPCIESYNTPCAIYEKLNEYRRYLQSIRSKDCLSFLGLINI